MLATVKRRLTSKHLAWIIIGLIALLNFGPFIMLLKEGLNLNDYDQITWNFFRRSQLTTLLLNTFSLIIATGLTSAFLGTLLASLVSLTDLPGKKIFNYLFLLPISLPLYLLSYVYVGAFEFSGPFPTFFREVLGLPLDQWLNIKSFFGLVFVFTLGLYPYVYLLSRSAFLKMGHKMSMSAQALGMNNKDTFFKILLPYAKPWIFSGTLLAMMEALADFGGVTLFHYDTLTTAIYTAWIGMYSLATAARLSLFLILIALLLYTVEGTLSKRARHTTMGTSGPLKPLFRLTLPWKIFGVSFSVLIVFLAVLLPFLILINWLPIGIAQEGLTLYGPLIYQTVKIAILACLFTVTVACLLLYTQQLHPYSRSVKALTNLSLLGYALPGTLIAVAVVLFFQNFGLALGSSLFFLIMALGIRFLTVGHRPLFAGIKSINPNLTKASRIQGAGPRKTFFKVSLPLLGPSILASLMLLFIEIVKEMPITLMLRPFGLSTLSTRLFELTTEGEWERASISGIMILFLGLIGPYLLNKLGDRL